MLRVEAIGDSRPEDSQPLHVIPLAGAQDRLVIEQPHNVHASILPRRAALRYKRLAGPLRTSRPLRLLATIHASRDAIPSAGARSPEHDLNRSSAGLSDPQIESDVA
ncbi:hypothetical protein GCM10027415_17340 [Humibacter ginsengisoli]